MKRLKTPISSFIIMIVLMLILIVTIPLASISLLNIKNSDDYNLHVKKGSYELVIYEDTGKFVIITDQDSVYQKNPITGGFNVKNQ